MAIKKRQTKKPSSASGISSSVVQAMAEMSPAAANPLQPVQLPPGVYFSPTRNESVGILNRWIAGEPLHDTHGFVFHDNVYGASPDELRARYPPSSIRGRVRSWWFLSETKFQSRKNPGAGARRADRRVATGGYWRMDQSRMELAAVDGVKKTLKFYVGPGKKASKTPWLMEEFTSALDDGTGKSGAPALYRLYLTPNATNDELREIFGEDGVRYGPDGQKKPARALVPPDWFDSVAALLPPGRVRRPLDHQPQGQGAPPPGLMNYHGLHLGPAPPGNVVGLYDQVWEAPPPPPPAYSPGILDETMPVNGLGQYDEQQGQFFSQTAPPPPPPPPASPGLSAEMPVDDLSMPFDEFLQWINENPV
ncbi:NAC domain containing protein 52 [Brachypodium distachyon]|uniref:NAC domain containing protein 52 n=1 Tax=Brachypodium distachyon TaxID=15368 RepID=UPI0001C73B71|nr:NAC domain containing protein 52 [Brachypodium distachyon]|eukprot:XP_010236658.3 NAC domain containing protein 52 [Brachypodium distachyon]